MSHNLREETWLGLLLAVVFFLGSAAQLAGGGTRYCLRECTVLPVFAGHFASLKIGIESYAPKLCLPIIKAPKLKFIFLKAQPKGSLRKLSASGSKSSLGGYVSISFGHTVEACPASLDGLGLHVRSRTDRFLQAVVQQ